VGGTGDEGEAMEDVRRMDAARGGPESAPGFPPEMRTNDDGRVAPQAAEDAHHERGVERAVQARIDGLLPAGEGAAMGGARGAHAVRPAPPQTLFRMGRTSASTRGAADVRTEDRAAREGRAGARGAGRAARDHGHVAQHSPPLVVVVPTEGVRVGGVCARTEPVAPSRECRKTFFEEAADLVEKRQRQKRRGREREISFGGSGRGGSSRRRTGTGRAGPMNDWTCQQEGEGGKRRKKRSNSVELWIGYQSIYHS